MLSTNQPGKIQQSLLALMTIFAVVLIAKGQTYQLLIDTSTSMASARSNYTFQIMQQDDYNITANTNIQIIFPLQYQGIMTDGNYDCYISEWISGATVNPITCSLLGLTFTINGAFTGIVGTLFVPAITYYGIIINEIINPMYAVTTGAFSGLLANTITNSSIFLFNTDFGMSGIQITEGVMTCLVSSTVSTTTSSSGMKVSITPTIMIPYNTTITIQMQKYWPTNAFNTTLIISSASCQNGTNTSATIQCGMLVKPTTLQITVANVVSADVLGGIQFYIYSIINPPTNEPQGSIDMITRKDGNKLMARCSGTKMTGIQPINFITASYLVTNYAVNAITSAFVVFKINSLVINTDLIQITLPSTITAVNVLSYVVLTNGNITNYSPIVIYNSNTSKTTIRTSGASLSPGSTIQLQLYNVKNPPSQATTASLGIALKRNNYLMEQLNTVTNPLLFKARRGVITGTLSVSTAEVGLTADYTVNIQLTNQISSSSDSRIIVYFPTIFANSIGPSSSCVPACLILTSTKAVFLAANLSSLTATSLTCTLQLLGLKNPLQIGATTSLSITTQLYGTNNQSIVDEITSGLSVNLTSRQITTITISSDSNVVYHYPTQFTITVTNNNDIPAYSSLMIALPSAISVDAAQVSCMLGTRSIPCGYNITTHSITMTSISSVLITAGGLPSIHLYNLFNPTSTMPTSTFKFYIINQFSQTIEKKESGLIYTASTPTVFNTISVTPNMFINSYASTSLTISLSLAFDGGYVNNSLLVVNLPMQVSNVGASTCTLISSNLQSITCTKSANTIKARLIFSSLTSGVQISFKIQFYTNYPSIEPYNIGLILYTSTLEQFKIAEETVTQVNSVLSPLTVNSFSFTNAILTESTILAMSITPAYTGQDLKQVFITLPAQFGVSGGSCSSLPVGLSCVITGNVYKITQNSSTYVWTMPLQFSLTGITAPSYTPSTAITIESRSASGYLMSRDISVKFTTSCNLPCRTCSSIDPTQCLSCYSNPLLVSSKTLLSGSQCVAACANRFYFNNNTGQCDSCSSLCQLCVDYSYCTSCPTGIFLYRINHTCVSSCPFGYYPSISYTCQLCTAALFCASCNNDYQCLSCIAGYFFYQGLCIQACPTPITYSDSILKLCVACPTNCTKCTGSVNATSSTVACTECSPSYLLDTSTQRCFLQCLIPGTVPNGNQCVSCQSTCLTCSLAPTNCTTCDTSATSVNKYLHNNRCLSICPSFYYPSNSSYTCLVCTYPCQTCTSGSISSCITCVNGTYLYGTSCVANCPNLYYPNVFQCTPCTPPCLNCISQLQCISCVSGSYLYGSNCVGQCDPGMTIINGNQCLVCSSTCKTCSASTYCTSCYPTNYLYNGTCSITCPNGTYRDNTLQICVACNNPCLQCSSSSYCITCINTALFVENGACVAACSGNLIPVNSMCTACNPACLTCVGGVSHCVVCTASYYFVYGNLTYPNCVATCTLGYIYDNKNATNNYQCLSACPPQYYATTTGTNCQPCTIGCYSCTNLPTNCSSCLSSYYLLSSTSSCTQLCPNSAPFPTVNGNVTSGTCQLCNMTICGTCAGLNSCGSCRSNSSMGLLVYEGITSRSNTSAQNMTCISSCPTNHTYNSSQLLCQTTQTNPTNSTNTTTNTTNPTPSSTPTAWTYKLIPNYLFTIISACILPIIAISKYQMPATNVQICMYVVFAVFCTAGLAHVMYFQGVQIFHTAQAAVATAYTKVGAISSSDFIALSNLTVYVQNPTTILSLIALFLHVLGSVVLLISLACTRDYSLIPIINSHPFLCFILLLLFCVEYKLIWILNSALFGAEIFMVKYCQTSTVRMLKVITVIGITEAIIQAIYGVYVIILCTNNASTARLLLSNNGIPSITYLHPYIQLTIMSSLTIFFSICVLTTKEGEYYIERVPSMEQTGIKQKKTKKSNNYSENNQSMNELLSEKDAAFRRFSTGRDLDDGSVMMSLDEDYLHDFGVGTNQPVEEDVLNNTKKSSGGKLTRVSHRSNITNKTHKTNITRKSKKEVQKAEYDVQVNLDEMLLPNIVEQDENEALEKVKEAQKKQPVKTEVQTLPQKNEQIVNIIATAQINKEETNIVEKVPSQKKDQEQDKDEIKQEETVLKSQPSWSSFKLGNKYKQEMQQEEEYLGYVCRTQSGHGEQGQAGKINLLDKHGQLVASKTITKSPQIKNVQVKVIDLDSESEEIDDIEEEKEQQFVYDEIISTGKRDQRLKIVTNRIQQQQSDIPQISEQPLYYREQQSELSSRKQKSIQNVKPISSRQQISSRLQEQEYEQEIQLVTRPKTQSIHQEQEYQQQIQLVTRPKTQSIKSKQQTIMDRSERIQIQSNPKQVEKQNNQNQMLSEQSSALINDPNMFKKSVKDNIFYCDDEPEELLSENIPAQYKVKEPSQDSQPFQQFKMHRDIEDKESGIEQFGGDEFGYIYDKEQDIQIENKQNQHEEKPQMNQQNEKVQDQQREIEQDVIYVEKEEEQQKEIPRINEDQPEERKQLKEQKLEPQQKEQGHYEQKPEQVPQQSQANQQQKEDVNLVVEQEQVEKEKQNEKEQQTQRKEQIIQMEPENNKQQEQNNNKIVDVVEQKEEQNPFQNNLQNQEQVKSQKQKEQAPILFEEEQLENNEQDEIQEKVAIENQELGRNNTEQIIDQENNLESAPQQIKQPKQNESVIISKDTQQIKIKKREQKNPQSLLALLKAKRKIKMVVPDTIKPPLQVDDNKYNNFEKESQSNKASENKVHDPPERDIPINDMKKEGAEEKSQNRSILSMKKDKPEQDSKQNDHGTGNLQSDINLVQDQPKQLEVQKSQRSQKMELVKSNSQRMSKNEEQIQNGKEQLDQPSSLKDQIQQIESVIKSNKLSAHDQQNKEEHSHRGQEKEEKAEVEQIQIQNDEQLNKTVKLGSVKQKSISLKQQSIKKSFREYPAQQSSKVIDVHTPIENYEDENKQLPQITENKNMLKNQIEMIRKHRPERSQILEFIETKEKSQANQDIQDLQTYLEREQTEHHTQMDSKNRKAKKIQIEYDDAEHFNETHNQGYKKNEELNYNSQQLIYRAPSEMGASLLIVLDDTLPIEQENNQVKQEEEHIHVPKQKEESIKQSNKQPSTKSHKGITFIEDLNELDEIVKTPIRLTNIKSKPKPQHNPGIQSEDTKPSQYIYNKKIMSSKPTNDKNSEGLKKTKIEQSSGRQTKPKFTYATAQKDTNRRIEKVDKIIYQVEDTEYDEKERISSNQKPHQIISRYNTIGHNSERRSSQQKSTDQKPSTILRGSFKKIGEILMRGNQEK